MIAVHHSFADINHQRLDKMQQPETAKSIHVYLNGDRHFAGRKLVVNRRYVADFDGFLNQVTHSLKAPFGAVRNIYTPQFGHRLHSLNELEGGMRLVAGGVEKFRKLEYNEIGSKRRHPRQRRNNLIIQPGSNRIHVSARWRKYVKQPCQIFVYANGDINSSALRLLLIPRIMQSWDLILNEITEKICARTGEAVRKLYDMDFRLLTDPSELESGKYYVAVGTSHLKRYPYGNLHSKNLSQRRIYQPLPPIKRRPRPPPREDGDKTYTKMYAQKKKQKVEIEETTVMGASAATGYRPLKVRKYKTSKLSYDDPNEEPVFPPPKPVKVKRLSGASSSVKHDIPPTSDENDGVFKRGTYEFKAETVDDDENTKVDLPIDQVAPVEVEEEKFDKVEETVPSEVEKVTTYYSDKDTDERQKNSHSDYREDEIEKIPEASNILIEEVTSEANATDRQERERSLEIEEDFKSSNTNETPTNKDKEQPEKEEEEAATDDAILVFPEAQKTTEKEENLSENDDDFLLRDTEPKRYSQELSKEIDEVETSNSADSGDIESVPEIESLQVKSRSETEIATFEGNANVDDNGLNEKLDEDKSGVVLDESDDVIVKQDDENANESNENNKEEVVESPTKTPVDDSFLLNRSLTPSSPQSRKKTPVLDPTDENQDLDTLSINDEKKSLPPEVFAENQSENKQSSSPLPQIQDSLEVSKQNGEISARPASDVPTIDDEQTTPWTPSSKKSVPNGDLTESTKIS